MKTDEQRGKNKVFILSLYELSFGVRKFCLLREVPGNEMKSTIENHHFSIPNDITDLGNGPSSNATG